MRIIKNPTEYEKTCCNCDCVFAFTRADVTIEFRMEVVECPSCKTKLNKDITKPIIGGDSDG